MPHMRKLYTMKNKTNVTVAIPKALLSKFKALAAHDGKSLSGLLLSVIEEMVGQSADYEEARKRQVALMNKGIDLGTNGLLTAVREKIHARS